MANSKYKPPGGLILGGRFNGGFFALRFWGVYIWRGLFSEFYGILFVVLGHSPAAGAVASVKFKIQCPSSLAKTLSVTIEITTFQSKITFLVSHA